VVPFDPGLKPPHHTIRPFRLPMPTETDGLDDNELVLTVERARQLALSDILIVRPGGSPDAFPYRHIARQSYSH
jgi:hypothetical protein